MGLGDVRPMGSWGKRPLVASWILNCFSWHGSAIVALPDRLLQFDLTVRNLDLKRKRTRRRR